LIFDSYVSDLSRQLRHSRHLQFKREQRLKDIFFNYTQKIKRSAQLSEDGFDETTSHEDVEEENDDEDYATDEDEIYYKNDFDRHKSNLDKSHILMNSEFKKYKEKYCTKWYSNKSFYDSESDSGDDGEILKCASLECRDTQNGFFPFEPYHVVETCAEPPPYINYDSLPPTSNFPSGEEFLEDAIDLASSTSPLALQRSDYTKFVREEEKAIVFSSNMASATAKPENNLLFDITPIDFLLDEINTSFEDIEATQILVDADTFDYPGERATQTSVGESHSDVDHTISIDALDDFKVLEQTVQVTKNLEFNNPSDFSCGLPYFSVSVNLKESNPRDLVVDSDTNVIQDCDCGDKPELDVFPHAQELATTEARSPSKLIENVVQDLWNPISSISLVHATDAVLAESDSGKDGIESGRAVCFDENDQNSPCNQSSLTMQLKRLSRQRGLSGYERSAFLKAKYLQSIASSPATTNTCFRRNKSLSSRSSRDKMANGFDINSYLDHGNLDQSLDVISRDSTKGLKFGNYQIPQIVLNVFPDRINSSRVNDMRNISTQLRGTLCRPQDNADNGLWVWRKTFLSTENDNLSQPHCIISKPMCPPPSLSRSFSIRAAPLLQATLPKDDQNQVVS
jgi:hypothetical protein